MDTKLDNKCKLTKLNIIPNIKGNIIHVIKKDEKDFKGFGELYFSEVKYKSIKAWKNHSKQTCNFIVPSGEVLFVVILDENSAQYKTFRLGAVNNYRLTVKPSTWFGFMGLGKGTNYVMNLSNLIHDPKEVFNKDIDYFDFDWSKN